MDIISNLLKFLQTNAKADMGTFGVFSKKRLSGSFDKSQQTFTPPTFELNFNDGGENKNDDFIKYIAEENKITFQEASAGLNKFCDDIVSALANDNKYEAKNLGSFYNGDEGRTIVFKAADNLEIDNSYFGMPKVDAKAKIARSKSLNESLKNDTSEIHPPEIENIELDEVQTDFDNTLAHLDDRKIDQVEVSESNTENQGEQIVKLDSGTEIIENLDDEPLVNIPTEDEATPIVEPPLSVAEKEAIFSNTDIDPNQKSESPSIEVESESLENKAEEVVEVPEAVLEQHQEHPNKFGTDPMEVPTQQSIWPKVVATLAILLLIGGLVYFFQPNLFNTSTEAAPKVVAPIDSNILQETTIDTVKFKQDSTLKADSILKANMITTTGTSTATGKMISNNLPLVTFEVIAASYKTEKSADNYIKIMKRKGYDAKIANMTGPWKKVSIASFDNEQEAKKQLYILQKKLKGNGFYVQKIKNP